MSWYGNYKFNESYFIENNIKFIKTNITFGMCEGYEYVLIDHNILLININCHILFGYKSLTMNNI